MKKIFINRKPTGLKHPKSGMRKLYKRILIGGFALVVLCGSPSRLYADFVDGIQMVSQSYSISAQWNEHVLRDGLDTIYTGGYDLSTSDGTPVTASTVDILHYLGAHSSIGSFSLSDYASTAIAAYGSVQTQAQGLWDFSPEGSSLNVNLSIHAQYSWYGLAYGGLSVTLTDMTTSSTLLNVVNPVEPYSNPVGYYGQTNYTFVVDPSHVYEFVLSGHSNDFDGDGISLDISAVVTSVPEPASLSLLAFGLLGVTLLRRQHRQTI